MKHLKEKLQIDLKEVLPSNLMPVLVVQPTDSSASASNKSAGAISTSSRKKTDKSDGAADQQQLPDDNVASDAAAQAAPAKRLRRFSKPAEWEKVSLTPLD